MKILLKNNNGVLNRLEKGRNSCMRMIENYSNLFFRGLLLAIIIHLPVVTLQLSNPDTRLFAGSYKYFASSWEVSLGRFCLHSFDILRGGLASPLVSFAISSAIIVIIGITICELFCINSILGRYLIILAFIVMPSFSYTLSYWYCSDSYCFSFFLSILAVFIPYKYGKKGIWIGILAMVISCAIYQPYLGVTAGLMICMLILDLLNKDKISSHICKTIMFLGEFIGGVTFYWIIVKLIRIFSGVELSKYSGVSDISVGNSLVNLPTRLYVVFRDFVSFFVNDKIVKNLYWKRNYLWIITFLIVMGFVLVKIYIINDKARLLLFALYIVVIPIAFNIIEIAAPSRDINILQTASMSLVLPSIIGMFEKYKTSIVRYIVYVLTMALIWTFFLQDNATYLSVQTTQNQVETVMQDVYSRIQCLDEYGIKNKVLFNGYIDKNIMCNNPQIYRMSYGLWSDMNAFWDTYEGTKYNWFYLFFEKKGIKINMCSDEEYKAIINNDAFKEMPIYPHKDSINVIDDVVVVKFSE